MRCPAPVFRRWYPTSSGILIDFLGPQRFYRFALPPNQVGIWRAYHEMVKVSGLSCPPTLVFVESLGGEAGIYFRDLIMLGIRDAFLIAARIMKSSRKPRTPKRLLGLTHSVLKRVLAHEIGHALDKERALQAPFRDAEARADFAAGWIDAMLGGDPWIGREVFRAIGCESLGCTHPSAAGRAHAYITGRQRAIRSMLAV